MQKKKSSLKLVFLFIALATAPAYAVTVSPGTPVPLANLSKLPFTTATVSFKTSHGPFKGSFTGPLLWTVLVNARAILPAKPRIFAGEAILVIGQDGYTAVLAAGEIAPALEDKPVILAEQMNGKPLGPNHLRLIVPGDKFGARSVKDVVSITVLTPRP